MRGWISFVMSSASTLLTAIALVSCGGADPLPPPDPRWRPILERARAAALADSILLAGSSLERYGLMRFEFEDGDADVAVIDRFLLAKKSGGGYTTQPLEHVVTGDTTLLADMYTFKTAKGAPRAPGRAELGGLHFGADFLVLLRELLETPTGGEAGYLLVDSSTTPGTIEPYHFRYQSAIAGEGEFWIDRDSCRLLRFVLDRTSSYVIGGYAYHLDINYESSAEGYLLPRSTSTKFIYSRPFSKGTGSIIAVLDTVPV